MLLLYVAPPALVSLMQILDFAPDRIARMEWLGVTSPFSALFSIPLNADLKREFDEMPANVGNVKVVIGYFVVSTCLLGLSTLAM